MEVTLGGDRLGSGQKNKQYLKNYHRSTHNLSQSWTSSMQVGTLYPFLILPAMRGDKFVINLEADARTVPTKGPLFGSFKMQTDVFQCDARLYQAILHNNPLAIGLKMGQVMFPQLDIMDKTPCEGFSNSSLMKYLGLSGIAGGYTETQGGPITRRVNAIPALAYYEIFKTYYANKQEENAYVIGTQNLEGDITTFTFTYKLDGGGEDEIAIDEALEFIGLQHPIRFKINFGENPENGWRDLFQISFLDENQDVLTSVGFNDVQNNRKYIEYKGNNWYELTQLPRLPIGSAEIIYFKFTWNKNVSEEGIYYSQVRGLEPFKLSNIDDMRLLLLSEHTLGKPFVIGRGDDADWKPTSGSDGTGLPYSKLTEAEYVGGPSLNNMPLNGLVVKTYQSDMFNNWVNTEWIDGENGINAITAISTASGSINIDTLNLAEKLYNMLNRIAVSDGSYEGWQDAVYTDTPRRHIESPIYLGGMSSEIVFEEIVQTAPADGDPLGTLGGKGKLLKRKGGHITVKPSEACFIIGIVSLTPRINYCQGNEFYMTDLLSMDDFHKPALDGIGFQNLIGERMAFWDTVKNGSDGTFERHSIGKIPAWMDYMTAVDKCYGDFAETEGRGFMTLLRDYTRDGNEIADATTYIDPAKYNYAFAVSDIEAQNFWVQIYSHITARRLMSAKQIPNI